MLKQHIRFICCINCNFCGTLTLGKKGSLKETCGVKHKYFLTCLEKPTRIPTGDRISKMPCCRKKRMVPSTYQVWWCYIIWLQLLALSNLFGWRLYPAPSQEVQRRASENSPSSRYQTLAADFCCEPLEYALHFYSEHTSMYLLSCILRSNGKKNKKYWKWVLKQFS